MPLQPLTLKQGLAHSRNHKEAKVNEVRWAGEGGRGEPQEGGQEQTTWSTANQCKNFDFFFFSDSEAGSHWRVLKRGVTWLNSAL